MYMAPFAAGFGPAAATKMDHPVAAEAAPKDCFRKSGSLLIALLANNGQQASISTKSNSTHL